MPASRSGRTNDPVLNVSQIVTLDTRQLDARVRALDHATMSQIEAGMRLVLELVGTPTNPSAGGA